MLTCALDYACILLPFCFLLPVSHAPSHRPSPTLPRTESAVRHARLLTRVLAVPGGANVSTTGGGGAGGADSFIGAKTRANVRHGGELVERDLTSVCIDGAHSGVGGIDSWGSLPLPHHRIPWGPDPIEFAFAIHPLPPPPESESSSAKPAASLPGDNGYRISGRRSAGVKVVCSSHETSSYASLATLAADVRKRLAQYAAAECGEATVQSDVQSDVLEETSQKGVRLQLV